MAENRTLKGIYGEAGATMLTGTDSVTKDICAILVIEAAVFDGHGANATTWGELTDVSGTDGKMLLRSDSAADGVTVPVGTTLYGQFSKVTLRSGTVLCYHASK
tara:strand:- start:200 stop:511 length:312 start_codon:yes stop_codon:yes gene_type:complete